MVFQAFTETKLEDVKVVIVGQDPTPVIGKACGLAFSAPSGAVLPEATRILKYVNYNHLGYINIYIYIYIYIYIGYQ